jgi:predicted GNAT family N-acyltransferase
MIEIKEISDMRDLVEAFRIRRVVFVTEQNVDSQEEYDEFENESKHYLAVSDKVPVGTFRWRTTDEGVKLERFAVLKAHRSLGIGKALVRKALEDTLPLGKTIYLHAQVQVISFYRSFGFKEIDEVFEEAGILHKKMIYDPS